jgi:hypothetical protein
MIPSLYDSYCNSLGQKISPIILLTNILHGSTISKCCAGHSGPKPIRIEYSHGRDMGLVTCAGVSAYQSLSYRGPGRDIYRTVPDFYIRIRDWAREIDISGIYYSGHHHRSIRKLYYSVAAGHDIWDIIYYCKYVCPSLYTFPRT